MKRTLIAGVSVTLLLSSSACKLTGKLPAYRETNRARSEAEEPYRVDRRTHDLEAIAKGTEPGTWLVDDSVEYVRKLSFGFLSKDVVKQNKEKLELASGGAFDEGGAWETLSVDPYPDVEVILGLSGGGMRAANLASAVMFELSRVPLEDPRGRPLTLLDSVDTLSSVSGGGFAAGFYLYHRPVFRENLDPEKADFHRDMIQAGLGVNLQRKILDSLIMPFKFFNLVRTFTRAGRTKLYSNAIEYHIIRPQRIETLQAKVVPRVWRKSKVLSFSADFLARVLWILAPVHWQDQYLFRGRGRTFDDLYLRDLSSTNTLHPIRPEWLVNATVYNEPVDQNGFLFDDESFNRYRSDWLNYRISDAVATSAAFPVLLRPVSWRDWSSEKSRWLFLFDGGVAGNLGTMGVNRVLERKARGRRAVVILVDASPRKGRIESENANRPSGMAISNRALERYMLEARDQAIADLRELEKKGHLRLFHLSIQPEEFGQENLTEDMEEAFEAANRIGTGLSISREEQDTIFEVARILVARDREAILDTLQGARQPTPVPEASSPAEAGEGSSPDLLVPSDRSE
jgi:hypothetical protein